MNLVELVDDYKCPICNLDTGRCDHLISSLLVDEQGEVFNGKVQEISDRLFDKIVKICTLVYETEGFIELGEAFGYIREIVLNDYDPDEDDMDYFLDSVASSYIDAGICELISSINGVKITRSNVNIHSNLMPCHHYWSDNAHAALVELESMIDESLDNLEYFKSVIDSEDAND